MTDKKNYARPANALKDAVPATAQIQMRVTPERKNRYVHQAQKEGMKLSEWIQKQLDGACEAGGSGEKGE